MVYCFGTLIQEIEYQNLLLQQILTVLGEPFETQVKEYYHKGCLFVRQGFLEGAVNCFKESISLKMGEYYFPSYYQLGRIYLSGKEENTNMIDLKAATVYLLKANEFGNRIVKTDSSFIKILAECKLFLSQSYYFQLTGKSNSYELDLLMNAIKYCKEAIFLNPNLSQAIYHLAKYISYGINKFNELNNNEWENLLLLNYYQAVKIDRNYLRSVIKGDPLYDKVFEPNIEKINNLILTMTNEMQKMVIGHITPIKEYISQLENKGIEYSSDLRDEFHEALKQFQIAELDYNSGTYFGYGNCDTNLYPLKKIFPKLLEKRINEVKISNKKLIKYIAIFVGSIFIIYLVSIIISWIGSLSGWEIAGYVFLFFVITGIIGKIFGG
jgi:tetratricopeptide (TPR) repeat protein